MNTEQILREQIKELEKLLELKGAYLMASIGLTSKSSRIMICG